jgi:hypothetical protein
VDGLEALLAQSLLIGIERQRRLADVIKGSSSWSVDVEERSLSFADGPAYAMDIVGSAAAQQGIWLWAWANEHLPDPARAASERLRRYGEEHQIEQLTTGTMPLGEPPQGMDGHVAGLIATPLLDGQAYYLAENGQQTVVLAIYDQSLQLGPLSGADLRTTLTTGLGMYGIGHIPSIRAYLSQRRAEVQEHGPEWRVTTADGQVTELRFDDQGRVTSFGATLNPEPQPRARRLWRRR